MTQPVAPFTQPAQLVGPDGIMSEGVNKVAVYFWDIVSLAWVKATGGSVPGANVNVTNFPPFALDATLVGLSNKVTNSNTNVPITDPTSTIVTKSVLTGQKSDGTGYANVGVIPDGSLQINQNTVVNTANSTTTNLAVGATFTGAWTADLPYTSAQFTLKTDQNCLCYLEQSTDGINVDISDVYSYYANQSSGGFGQSVQLTASYHRVRVTNVGFATTTYFRLQQVNIPFLSSLPRTLDSHGFLQVAVKNEQDLAGHAVYHSIFGEEVAVPLFRLIGQVFSSPSGPDPTRWTSVVGTGGTATESGGLVTISTGTTANNTVSVQSIAVARYLAGQHNIMRAEVILPDTGTVNNVRRGGVFDANNGVFFELNGTVFSIVTRKAGVDTKISNGTFNGVYGSTFLLDTNAHRYDIQYSTNVVEFYMDGLLLHRFQPTTTSYYANIHLPIRVENFNTGGSTTNVTMYVLAAYVAKIGIPEIQAIGYFISAPGTTTIKTSPGVIKSILMSNIANNSSVVIYDNTSATGIVIWNSGVFGAQTVPFGFDFKDIAFNIGLTVVVTGVINLLVMYD